MGIYSRIERTGRTLQCNMHYAPLHRVREVADTKAFDRLLAKHDDVLLYVAGKNEDAIAVVLTEDRTNAF